MRNACVLSRAHSVTWCFAEVLLLTPTANAVPQAPAPIITIFIAISAITITG
jgi:hypothetical protein